MVYDDPRLICSAQHTTTGVTVKFPDAEYTIPHEKVWHLLDVLRSHVEDYGAVDVYGRPIEED